ncbi:MAG: transcription termination/antitermination protein NusG [Verrucomicrobiae bacterium]|nr:transcription termination/antitermination protein NusG [Verrucomicrobiae bacterium]
MSDKQTTQWYVLHCLPGQEQKVMDSIEKRKSREEVTDLIHRVLIPTERVEEVKRGKRATTTRKFYPGYLIVNMDLLDENNQLIDRSWYFIRDTPGVIGFVGGEKPIPLRKEEVDSILAQIQDREDRVVPKINFGSGETLNINDGPFKGMQGVVEEVDQERGKLKVSVSIFGRSTPVELEFWQVEKT